MSDLLNFNNWQMYTLTDLAHYHNGYAFKPKDWAEDGVKIIRIEQLNKPDGQYDHYAGIYPFTNQINDGDLIFSWSATLKVVIWNHGEAVLNQHLFRVDAKDGFEKQYIYYVLDHHMEFLAGGSHGSTMKHIKRGELQKYRVPIPPLSFQRKIASILNTIDRTIAKTEALIKKYQQIKAGLMYDLFTRGIGADGKLRPHREEAPELYRESAIGWIPKEWSIQTVESLGALVTSGSREWAKYYSREGALFIRIGNLTREHINFRFDSIQRVLPPADSDGQRTKLIENDILVSITADLGIIGVIPKTIEDAYINQHIALIRFSNTNIYSRFFGHFFASHVFQNYVKRMNDSGAKAGLNLPAVRAFPAILTTKKEQSLIAQRLDAIDVQIKVEKQVLTKFKKQKSGLMHDLLTGKVSVNVDAAEVACE